MADSFMTYAQEMREKIQKEERAKILKMIQETWEANKFPVEHGIALEYVREKILRGEY